MPILRLIATCSILCASVGACYAQGGGCTNLWLQRNRIYADAGYCFKTGPAIRAFGNANCRYESQYDVPLSADQRAEIAAIIREERELGCR